jgi:hypothetical protein
MRDMVGLAGDGKDRDLDVSKTDLMAKDLEVALGQPFVLSKTAHVFHRLV